jgi:ABC-type multidrug transport system fused ATPase/permease subunit
LEIHLASALTALVILALGAVLIHQGWTTIAEATTILVLNQSIFTGVRQIVLQWGHAEENSDLLAMLLTGESEDSAATSPSGRPITEPIQSIECIEAAFAVQELVLLQKVTCRLEAGRLYGVSGASGSGKTMLLHLLAGTAHAASGRVLVNGNDTQELDLHSFRRRVALVTWPPLLVEGGTIAENLRLARRDATDDDLRECLRLAAMETDLVRLESVGGLAAKLGRAGVQLSVGQMQRLAIARALLRKPDVLLIDDLLTGLDPETCGQVMQSLRSYARSHLVVIVAPHERIAEMCDELLITRAGSLAA